MSMHDLLVTLRRLWWVPLLCAVLGLGAGVVSAKSAKTTFTATSSALVALPGANSASELQAGDTFTMSRARSYALLASSRRVLDKVAQDVHAGNSDLTGQVAAAVQPETSVIDVQATDGDPAYAATLANATVKELGIAVREIDAAQPGKTGAPISIVQMSPAAQPTTPAKPESKMYALFGLVSGLTVGLLLALLLGRRPRRPAAPGRRGLRRGATRVVEED